jgi:serine/threonine-protein kinase HipA
MTSKPANDRSLLVYSDIDGSPIWVGTLDLGDSFGEVSAPVVASFCYAPPYLKSTDALPLDPLNMPLCDHVFRTTSRFHLLGALFDAVPDAWGRRVIRASGDGAAVSERNVFVRARGLGAGNLFYKPIQPIDELGATAELLAPGDLPSLDDIPTIAKALAAIDSGDPLEASWRSMLTSSCAIGGARPKAIVRDAGNDLWVAKFPRQIDSFDKQRVEWANLEMARDIGITVPMTRLVKVGRDAVLLVKRFDHTIVDENIRRRHYVSAATLISPPPDFDKREMDKPFGQSIFSYARLAEIIRRVSSKPVRDLQELYARMLLNVAVHNTDDHLKNTGFLRDESSNAGNFRLSPLFDVVTQEGNARHMLHLGPVGRESTFQNALDGAGRIGLRPRAAKDILDRVLAVTERRRDYYHRAGLAADELAIVERCQSAWRSISHKNTPMKS